MKNLIAVLAIIAALAVTLPARAALLSYDGFNEGLTNYPTSLHMSTNGFGWRAAWTVQGTGNTGYRITNGPALFYLDGASQPLLTNGMLAAGGDAYTSSGRRIGLSETWEPDNAYTPYRKVFASAAYVGAEDTVLWFSALVRQQANNNDYKISLHANNIDWNEGSGFPYTRIAIGLSGGVWQL